MAAAAAIFDLLPGDAEVVLPDDCYQAVVGLAAAGQELGRWSVRRLAPDDTNGWLRAAEHADLLWLESPSNPLLQVADLPAILSQPRKPGAIAVVDNTFATPLGQQPLELGADLVLHSATKYLGGHSDLQLGAAAARDDELARGLRERRLLAGAIPGALETYLAVRGIRTLHLRLERATATAHELATRLECHPEVSTVRYPGLLTHPTHTTASRFMRSYGAMISFDVRGDAARADAICQSLQIIQHATSLGSVETTIERRAAIPGQEHLPPRCCDSALAAKTSKTCGQTSTAPSSGAGRRHVVDLTVNRSPQNPWLSARTAHETDQSMGARLRATPSCIATRERTRSAGVSRCLMGRAGSSVHTFLGVPSSTWTGNEKHGVSRSCTGSATIEAVEFEPACAS